MKKSVTLKVLNAGFITLEDIMGCDQTIVNVARVSTGIKGSRERDKKLIHFLMEHDHGTPFESVIFRFHVKCPIFVARQWFRHRIASYNEYSLRYRKAIRDYYIPKKIFTKSELKEYRELIGKEFDFYEKIIARSKKLPTMPDRRRIREVVRGCIGLAYYTEFYWTVNFRSLMNFLKLRTREDAQWEIRQYALAILKLVKKRLPIATEAFLKVGI